MENLDNEAKEIKTTMDTLKLTSFKDWHGFEWIAISDTPETFWKCKEKQCITITKREALLLAEKLTNFAEESNG